MKSLCYVFVDCLILRGRLIIHMGYGTEKILLKYCAYQYQNWLPTEQLPVTLLCVTLVTMFSVSASSVAGGTTRLGLRAASDHTSQF